MRQEKPIMLKMHRRMTDDEFFDFCQKNELYHIEREADGLVVVEEPSGVEYSRRHIRIASAVDQWNEPLNLGIVTDSSGGFTLPNGAVRAPDATWISFNRLAGTTLEDRQKFVRAVPEFVVEVRSRSDRMTDLRKKMQEYLDNGVLLGWLVNVEQEAVEIYRPGRPVEVVQGFRGTVSGDEVLPGFVFDLERLQ